MYLHINPKADLSIRAFPSRPGGIPFFVGVAFGNFNCSLWQDEAEEALAMLRQALSADSGFGKRFSACRVTPETVTLRFRESVTVFFPNDYVLRVVEDLAKALEQA